MSQYYRPKRTRNLFDPLSKTPFTLSRSKIDLFYDCPRCFYLDRRLGVGRPPGYPFNLNSAVDKLLKKEFDLHRVKATKHPLMAQYGIDAIPYRHADLDIWRENFKGVRYLYKPANFEISGAIDDVWINPKGELHVVDYKATAKDSKITIDAPWQISYKRQMEVYQWLLRQNDFKVSDLGYFVYANGQTDRQAFDGKLEFDVEIINYVGHADWIEKTLHDIRTLLEREELPPPGAECDYCPYRAAVHEFEIGGSVK